MFCLVSQFSHCAEQGTLIEGEGSVQQNPLSYSLDIANIIYKAIYPNEGKHTSLLYNSIN